MTDCYQFWQDLGLSEFASGDGDVALNSFLKLVESIRQLIHFKDTSVYLNISYLSAVWLSSESLDFKSIAREIGFVFPTLRADTPVS